ncbi:SNCAIP isoform 16 [Pan troglodytes]|uniref:Synphilin-1f protein n=6 Tax=Hominoidea TaxID=314295 RepID=Q6L981_HUMAN|nr:synuclein alpha interacting protein [Homo sapiens]KAI4022357.1 synuclein alpha interacting protein [Homo sapiens]PNI47667.1 SNCAIP isoform 15 [Pan troglodytes]PNI47668.1 SNCAIP isoform 16 [Pan troglodytes]BAD19022.1 synphilin-1f protein [Homo sapiens]
MEAPEYLDLDEIDFSDDISYSVTSLKTIPELCRRCDTQNEDRSATPSCRQSRQNSRRKWKQSITYCGVTGTRRVSTAPHFFDGRRLPQ